MTYCKRKLLVMIMAFIVSLSSHTIAQFEDTGCGARSAGMANAYTAGAYGPEAIYFNPAGLAVSNYGMFASSYGRLFWNLTDRSNLGNGFLGIAVPMGSKYGIGSGWRSFMLDGYYSENIFYMSFAGKMSNKIAVGLNLKMLYKEYGKTLYTEKSVNLETGQAYSNVNPVFNKGYSKSGYTADIGTIFTFNSSNKFALMMSNITSPDMALSGEDVDKVVKTLKFGYEYKNSGFNALIDIGYSNNDINLYSGVENWFFGEHVALRGGLGLGSREFRNIACGASLKHTEKYQLDYAFNYPLAGIRSTYGIHKVELTIIFRKRASYEDESIQEIKKTKKLKNLKEEKRKTVILIKNTKKLYRDALYALSKKYYYIAIAKLNEISMMDDKGMDVLREYIDKADNQLSVLTDIKNKYALKYLQKGKDYFRKQRYDSAIEEWNKVVNIDPLNETVQERINEAIGKLIQEYYINGMNYFIKEQYIEALEEFSKVLELDKEHIQAKEMITRIHLLKVK